MSNYFSYTEGFTTEEYKAICQEWKKKGYQWPPQEAVDEFLKNRGALLQGMTLPKVFTQFGGLSGCCGSLVTIGDVLQDQGSPAGVWVNFTKRPFKGEGDNYHYTPIDKDWYVELRFKEEPGVPTLGFQWTKYFYREYSRTSEGIPNAGYIYLNGYEKVPEKAIIKDGENPPKFLFWAGLTRQKPLLDFVMKTLGYKEVYTKMHHSHKYSDPNRLTTCLMEKVNDE